MTRLIVALIATVLSFGATAQTNSAAIKNAYSLGEVSASRIAIRSVHANNPQNQTMLADIAAVDQSIQRDAQKLGIDPQQVLTILTAIAPNSPDSNLLNSHGESAIEGILNAHGVSDKVVKAYHLGWKVAAYTHTCSVTLAFQQQNPGLAANFLGAYPAMVDQLRTGAADFGVHVGAPQAGLSLAHTCRELTNTATSLNHALQVH